ncbi:uncharacterized protein LOC143042237 [Mytilus galloprovincialis]|uniref:uncharacterized protein LOC143042237 n=1 Tax=Mytilus galloprovincialis TaxID=29158 RepID=UPI003F7CBD03
MEMKDVSISLYNYLCENIVGTENHVKTIRLMNAVSDNLSNDDIIVSITSGSFGEGLQMIGSDLDVMHVMKFIEVHDNITSNIFNPDTTYFSLVTEDTKPGYVMLRLTSSPHPFVQKMCEKFRGDIFLSNALFKESFLVSNLSLVTHGPCLSDKHGYFDLANCLHSKDWVTSASQWTLRSNNTWPNEKTKQMIMNHGVIFVPIGFKGSPHEELEWRMSFSVGEKFLIYTFSHTQLLCYSLMKILLKEVIHSDSRCEDLLCSYYLKTIIFWISEEFQPSVWTPDNLIPCFMRCFRRLIYCVDYSVCPNYFIPENNLFENKIAGLDRDTLIDTLRVLYSYGWRCILFSKQLSHVPILSSNVQTDQRALFYEDIKKLLKSNIFMGLASVNGEHNNFSRAVYYNLAYNSKKLKYLHAYFLSAVCCNTCESIYLSNKIGNKNQYKQYNTCQSYLLMNTNHDSVSGWLMLASFFYKANEYQKCLKVILYALSKCTPEKLFCGKELSDTHYLLFNSHLVQKQEVMSLLKYALIDNVIFNTSIFIPKELPKEESGIEISPVVYAHFVSFLCYYHLNNVRECLNSLRYLELTITEDYFIIKDKRIQSMSYYCLGIALQLMEENRSNNQTFKETMELLYKFSFR